MRDDSTTMQAAIRLMLAAVLIINLPGASAEAICVDAFCFEEASGGADCSTSGGSGNHYDRLEGRPLVAFASVEGYESCWATTDAHGRSEGIRVSAGIHTGATGTEAIFLEWSDAEETTADGHTQRCGYWFRPILTVRPPVDLDQPCHAGPPPKLDWGKLLP